ncbi:MAG TPA: hypothetical protein VM677_21980 [Actinokineospora sp.]|jgi:hypothetical protein|nr:hypothetical protein [Actinokineospora sp.]
MIGLRKRTLMGALLFAIGAIVVPTTSAQAATNCSGSIIGRTANSIGELVVYYNASTGYNCARMNHLGASYGVAASTSVDISKCTGTTKSNPGTCTVVQSSQGSFSYYAGPVSTYAPNNCIRAWGEIVWQGHIYNYVAGPHC